MFLCCWHQHFCIPNQRCLPLHGHSALSRVQVRSITTRQQCQTTECDRLWRATTAICTRHLTVAPHGRSVTALDSGERWIHQPMGSSCTQLPNGWTTPVQALRAASISPPMVVQRGPLHLLADRRITEALRRRVMVQSFLRAATPWLVRETLTSSMCQLTGGLRGAPVTRSGHGRVSPSAPMARRWWLFAVVSLLQVAYIGQQTLVQRSLLSVLLRTGGSLIFPMTSLRELHRRLVGRFTPRPTAELRGHNEVH